MSHEILTQETPLIEQLQEARLQDALKNAEHSAASLLNNMNLAETYSGEIGMIKDAYLSFDIGEPSATDLFAFNAIGISSEKVRQLCISTSEEADGATLHTKVDDEALQVQRYGHRGLTLMFKKDGVQPDFEDPQSPVRIIEKIREGFLMSPAHQAIRELAESFKDGSVPEKVTSGTFPVQENPLGTVVALESFGVVNSIAHGKIERVEKLTDALGSSVGDFSKVVKGGIMRGWEEAEDEGVVTYTKKGEVIQRFSLEKATGLGQFEVEQNPSYFYSEHADQAAHAESVPFVETRCAYELAGLLDQHGLKFNDTYVQEMTKTAGNKDRFGSIYTEMSREIAKWVNRPERTLVTNLFVPKESATEHDIRERITSMDVSQMSEPTQVLVEMTQQAITRPENPDSDLPITDKDILMQKGSCYDVTTYYIAGAKNLMLVEPEPGVSLLEKANNGGHTFLSTQPLRFNGVTVPKGGLFSAQDDGWALLRLTPFTFDNEADRLATGAEMPKTIAIEKTAIQVIGGTALEHLVAASRK